MDCGSDRLQPFLINNKATSYSLNYNFKKLYKRYLFIKWHQNFFCVWKDERAQFV